MLYQARCVDLVMKFLSMCILLFLCSCAKENKAQKELSYEDMMGKNMECWQYVSAPQDFANLAFFKDLYLKQSKQPSYFADSEAIIPKIIHFIWIGPGDFPKESIPNLQSWLLYHPDWQVKFWTDRPRHLPVSSITEYLITDWSCTELEKCYHKTCNFAEKSDILRYEILLREGGLYVDHDVKCFKSFDDLNSKYELYCGLELPSDTPTPSSIHVTNNLIAARPGHPVLQRCVQWLPAHWDEIEKLYPGSDKISMIRRIANRTFLVFADSVRALAGRETSDMVFPAFYFNAPTDNEAVYARHLYAGTWFQGENAFEKMVRQRLMNLSKKSNKILLFSLSASLLNFVGILFLIVYFTKKMKSIQKS
ncbi:MAG: hypothetical protein EBZ47_03175 [Chlamydiae bacterium]|nr:hypothetical protein [Chlamydiota bacterium]